MTGGKVLLMANILLQCTQSKLDELDPETRQKWLDLAEEALHHLDAEGEFEYNIQATPEGLGVYYLYPDWRGEKRLGQLKEALEYIRGDSSGRSLYKLVKRPVAGRVTDA